MSFQSKDNDPYRISKKLLNEYIDLKKIIGRLQDVDKLKNLLLNDSQKFFFDTIPKPEFSITNQKYSKLSISEKIVLKVKPKGVINDQILENYEKLCKHFTRTDDSKKKKYSITE